MNTGDQAHPRHYVAGVVIVSGREARLLEHFAHLNKVRPGVRGRDTAFDDLLLSLHLAALEFEKATAPARNLPASPAEEVARRRETAAPSTLLGTAEASSRLGLSRRRVQQLAKAGEFGATLVGNRYFCDPEAVEHYRKGG